MGNAHNHQVAAGLQNMLGIMSAVTPATSTYEDDT